MIRTRGGGTVSGSRLRIRCEQAQTQVEATSSRDASSLAAPDPGEKLVPGTGQLDAAWWEVGDSGGRRDHGGSGGVRGNSKLLSPTQPR